MDLLTENATLHQKIGLLEKSSNNENNPWLQKEISVREAKIEDLTKALEDRMSEVQLIEEKSSLQTLNESLVEKLQKQQEELHQTQSQLKDARDQADLLEFRVLELEEENEKVTATMSSVLRVTFKKNRFTFNPTANYDFLKSIYVDQSFS